MVDKLTNTVQVLKDVLKVFFFFFFKLQIRHCVDVAFQI